MYGAEALIPLIVLGVAVVIFVVPVVALIKAFSVGQQVESLRREIAQLRSALQQPRPAEPQREAPQPVPQAPVVAHTLQRLAEAKSPPPVTEVPDEPVPPVSPFVLEPVPPAPVQPVAPQPQYTDWRMSPTPAEPVMTRQAPASHRSVGEWEMLIGGNIVNRIAALGMVIVAAFFLKYAYDHHWIKPPLIVAIGFAAGLALLLAGARFHRANAQVFAQGLIGAGISILYLSGYATFSYELVTQPIALGIMSLVTVIAVIQALRYDSPVVCILGLLGGFLTPLLLGGHGGHGGVNHFGLFAYILLLDVGLLAVALKKDSWAAIDLLVLAGTYITYLVWFDQYFTRPLVMTAIPFVTIVWVLFCCVDICRIVRSISTYKELRAFIGVCSSGLFYIAMYVLLDRRFTDQAQFKHWMALVSLTIGAVYFLSLLIALRSRTEDRSFIPRYVLTAIALLAISTGLAYTGFLQASLWAVEALALIWCGLRWKVMSATGAGLALFGVAAIGLVGQNDTFAYQHLKAFVPLWNPRFAAAATLASALGLAAFLFGRSGVDEKDSVSSVLQTACCASVLVLLAVETNDYFRLLMVEHVAKASLLDYTRYMAIGGVWAVYSLVLMGLGLWRKSNLLAYLGLGALILATGVVAVNGFNVDPTRLFAPLLNLRVAGFAVAIWALVAGRSLLSCYRSEWAGALSEVVRAAIALLTLQLLSVETYMLFDGGKYGALMESTCRLKQYPLTYLALGTAWVLYSLPTAWIGIRRGHLVLAVIGLGALAAGVFTIATQGYDYYPIEKFTLIANARFAAFAIALIGLLLHYRMLAKRRETYPWIGGLLVVMQVVTSLLAFELATIETKDFFGKMATKPGEVLFRYSENMRQMTLSVVWLVYSFLLVSIGFWRRARTLRFVAMGLFGITILKVFISDLSFLEPLYRIFSFAGLAVILFATSYLYQRHRGLILGEEPAKASLPDEVE